MEQIEWHETLLTIRERIEESHEDQALEILSLDTTVLPPQEILFFEQNQTISEVLANFRQDHDYAIIVDNKASYCGIVSREVLQQVGRLLGINRGRMPISTIMRRQIVRESEGAPLYVILRHLTGEDATAVLVTDETGMAIRLLSPGILARFFMDVIESGGQSQRYMV